MWYYAWSLMFLYTPLSWVKNISYFSTGYIIGMAIVLFTTFMVAVYATTNLIKIGPQNVGF